MMIRISIAISMLIMEKQSFYSSFFTERFKFVILNISLGLKEETEGLQAEKEVSGILFTY